MESFWEFSVRTYRTDGVPDACLSLQNEHGADVNMLLYCAWVGAAAGLFDNKLFARASEHSTHWARNVVIPLREARTWMKHTGCSGDAIPAGACMQLRDNIKSVEFAAEKMQQKVLESMVTVDAARAAADQVLEDVAANLLLYLQILKLQPALDVREKLLVMVCAAFPHFDKGAVARALEP